MMKVFVGGPSDTDSAKKVIRKATESIIGTNNMPEYRYIDWQNALPGTGRPQERINNILEECDYTIIVFSRKYGTPPDGGTGFNSGTEEELFRSLKLMIAQESAMKEVALFFEEVPGSLIDDPGKQLKKVLKLKSRIEEQQIIQYVKFKDTNDLYEKVLQLLQTWRRINKNHHNLKHDDVIKFLKYMKIIPAYLYKDLLQNYKSKGKQLEASGKLDEAIHNYREAADLGDIRSMLLHIRALRRAGKNNETVEAIRAYERSIRNLEESEDRYSSQALLDCEVSIMAYREGRPEESMRRAKCAYDVARYITSHKDKSYVIDTYARSLERQSDYEGAERCYQESLDVRLDNGNLSGAFHSYLSLGSLYHRIGQVDKAKEMVERATELLPSVKSKQYARFYSLKGEVLFSDGQISKAITSFEKSEELNKTYGDTNGIAMAQKQLMRGFLQKGDLDKALQYANKSVSSAKEALVAETIATALIERGEILLKQGNAGAAALDAREAKKYVDLLVSAEASGRLLQLIQGTSANGSE